MPARLLLVHSPLTGPQTWDMIAPHLAEPGWPVILPDLTSTIADLGWPVARLISYHLAPLTDPAGVAAAVRDLLRQ